MTTKEQEYIKQVYLHTTGNGKIHTCQLASRVSVRPATTCVMIKKLAGKNLLIYQKGRGCRLSSEGLTEALKIVRRNRLWKVFLVQKLAMDGEEANSLADQLQYIESGKLVDSLSLYLGHPTHDPFGEAIPINF